jgi:hypothetical protein
MHITTIVHDFYVWQSNFLDEVSNSELKPMEVFVVHNSGILDHNFARYVYVHQLQKTSAIDCVVFLDDFWMIVTWMYLDSLFKSLYIQIPHTKSIMWPPNFVLALLSKHKPKGMTSHHC